MNNLEKAFFKNLVVPKSGVQLYWNNKRYTKEELLKLKTRLKVKVRR